MFDEQKEPVDIFAEVDPSSSAPAPGSQQNQGGTQSINQEKIVSSGPSKLLFGVIVLFILGIAGGGVWYFILRDSGNEIEEVSQTEQQLGEQTDNETEEPAEVVFVCGDGVCDESETPESCPEDCSVVVVSICGDGVCDEDETIETCPADCLVPANEPVLEPEPINQPTDSDGDGLSDEEERELGTNPSMVDTDGDGLSDREEVVIYKTDPLNPDTDGDGYLDGEEVKSLYNPLGEGKLLNLPE